MPRTPDRFPGALSEEGIYFDTTQTAATPGEQRYTGTRFSMCDATGEFDPRSGADFDDIVLDDDGRIVYIGDGVFVLKE